MIVGDDRVLVVHDGLRSSDKLDGTPQRRSPPILQASERAGFWVGAFEAPMVTLGRTTCLSASMYAIILSFAKCRATRSLFFPDDTRLPLLRCRTLLPFPYI